MAHAPVTQSDETLTVAGHCQKDGKYYEFQWHHEWMQVKTNENGVSGWATIAHSTNPACRPRTQCRVHLCAFNPCRANYPASKYGNVGPPLHLQEVQKQCEVPAVAEPSGSQLPLPEASSPAAGLAPVGPAPVVEPAPAEEPATALKQSQVLSPGVDTDMAEAPGCPKEAALKNMKPPAPSAPMHVDSQAVANATAVAVTAAASPAAAAQHTIEATLLALARDIRKPRAYVGYSAFILMGLLKKCQPCVLEGAAFMNLLDVFAPWAKEHCTTPVAVRAIPCTLVAQAGGSVELAPISEVHPLSKTSHFVAGIVFPGCHDPPSACSFEALYGGIGVAVLASVLDGDCALDVMTMMLGIPPSAAARADLRIELSDYLIARLMETWMHDVMVVCQELRLEDVNLYRSGGVSILAAPTAPAPAVAESAVAAVVQKEVVAPDEETFAAMRWASRLNDDSCVLGLIRSLPKEIVEEQLSLYRRRDLTTVAVKKQIAVKNRDAAKIAVGPHPRYQTKMMVAQRFHNYCKANCISVHERMPWGAMKTFSQDNIEWKAKLAVIPAKKMRQWYGAWQSSTSNVASTSDVVAAVAESALVPVSQGRSRLKSRAPVALCRRKNAYGAGRPPKAYCVREALYQWFAGIRYAIDWAQLIAENRSRGKKHLARFPRSLLKLKAQQLLQDYTYSCLLTGAPVVSFDANAQWFRRWEEDYGLSMRMANRKYAVPRPVVKERVEIFWVVLFRIRLFILLAFGYDPLILNFDQSPFHHNETGSQNKPTLAVKGSVVPVVEGNSDVKSRWTGNFTTQSRFTGGKGDPMPAVECMFKAERDGRVAARLQEFHRSHGFPQWFTVTVGPKGSYRELDVISWLEKHLEPWKEGRDWRVYLCDDYAAHKTNNVWNLCWSRGYVRIVHGGGTTPCEQTCDTDLNEDVRRIYGNKEACLLLEKMRSGQVVPRLTHEECMLLMLEVMSDPALHMRAAAGYKKVGQSIDLRGSEDEEVCREAGTYWNEETTDKFPSMRPKIDAELAAVADEFESGGITWCQRDVKRLITPYPSRPKVDRVLENLGEDFYHDAVHCLTTGGDATAVAEGDQEAIDSSSDGDDGDDKPADHVPAAVAGEGAGSAGVEDLHVEHAPLSASQADRVHHARATISALESTIDGLRAIGNVRGVQVIGAELAKERRRARQLVKESPAVADAFLRLRRAEEHERLDGMRIAEEHKQRKRDATKAIADRDAAVAELRETRRKIHEMEGVAACRYNIKTFTLEALGEGSGNAGGAKARKNRLEVLDRLARVRAGLSAGQKNDWAWFREAWDKAMAEQHGPAWATVFAGWMQSVLDDERSNAFSKFVYDETCRVFHDTAALHVPGG